MIYIDPDNIDLEVIHILYDIFQLVINLWAISGVKMLVDVPYRFYQYVAEFNDLLCSVAFHTRSKPLSNLNSAAWMVKMMMVSLVAVFSIAVFLLSYNIATLQVWPCHYRRIL